MELEVWFGDWKFGALCSRSLISVMFMYSEIEAPFHDMSWARRMTYIDRILPMPGSSSKLIY
jgi:hypothetical protein